MLHTQLQTWELFFWRRRSWFCRFCAELLRWTFLFDASEVVSLLRRVGKKIVCFLAYACGRSREMPAFSKNIVVFGLNRRTRTDLSPANVRLSVRFKYLTLLDKNSKCTLAAFATWGVPMFDDVREKKQVSRPMFEAKVFCEQMYCIEETSCDIAGTSQRPEHCGSSSVGPG